jgi:hypothetical protein
VKGRFRRLGTAAALACSLHWAAPAHAASASGGVSVSDVTVRAEPDSLFSGERIHYVITVRHDTKGTISVEGLETGPSTAFELAGRTESSRRQPDGSLELSVSTDIAAFSSGHQRLPGFTVTEMRNGRSRPSRLYFRPSSSVFVMNMTDSTMTRLRPVAPPVGPGFLPWLLLLPVVAVVLLLLFAVLHLLKQGLLKSSPGSLIDPVRAARQKLKSLDRQLSKGLSPSEGYENLSNILREFLQHRYRFRAMEQVTQEIAEELDVRQVRTRETVLKLLLRADLIKFADGRPDIEECRSSLRVAEAFFVGSGNQPDTIAPQGSEPSGQTSGESTR